MGMDDTGWRRGSGRMRKWSILIHRQGTPSDPFPDGGEAPLEVFQVVVLCCTLYTRWKIHFFWRIIGIFWLADILAVRIW